MPRQSTVGILTANASPFIPSQPSSPEVQQKVAVVTRKMSKEDPALNQARQRPSATMADPKRPAAIPIKAPKEENNSAETDQSLKTPLEKALADVSRLLPPGASAAISIKSSTEKNEAVPITAPVEQSVTNVTPVVIEEGSTSRSGNATSLSKQSSSTPGLSTYLYAYGIPRTLSWIDLELLFAKHHGVVLSRALGLTSTYVKFQTSDEAATVLKLSPLKVGNSVVSLSWPNDVFLEKAIATGRQQLTTLAPPVVPINDSKSVPAPFVVPARRVQTVRIVPASLPQAHPQPEITAALSNATKSVTSRVPQPSGASSWWSAKSVPELEENHDQGDLLEFSSDLPAQHSSPAKSSEPGMPSSPLVRFSPPAKTFTPARTTSDPSNDVPAAGLDSGAHKFLEMMKQGRVSRLVQHKYGRPNPPSWKVDTLSEPNSQNARPGDCSSLESQLDSPVTESCMSPALGTTTRDRAEVSKEKITSPVQTSVNVTTTFPEDSSAPILETAPELSFDPLGHGDKRNEWQAAKDEPSDYDFDTTYAQPVLDAAEDLDVECPEGVMKDFTCTEENPNSEQLHTATEPTPGDATPIANPETPDDETEDPPRDEQQANIGSSVTATGSNTTHRAPESSFEVLDDQSGQPLPTLEVDTSAQSEPYIATDQPSTQMIKVATVTGSVTDCDDNQSLPPTPSPPPSEQARADTTDAGEDLPSIPSRVDTPQEEVNASLFGSKLYRTTAAPRSPVEPSRPEPLILYTLAETLPWLIRHVNKALVREFGFYKYQIFETPGRVHKYLVRLHSSLAASDPLPDRLRLQITGDGTGPGGQGYFGELVRIDVSKACMFCGRIHEKSTCSDVVFVTDDSLATRTSTLTLDDIVNKVMRGRKSLAKPQRVADQAARINTAVTEQGSEEEVEHGANDDAADDNVAEVAALPTQPRGGEMQQSSSDSLSLGWSSSPTLHSSDFTNIESVEEEHLSSSLSLLSLDPGTEAAAVRRAPAQNGPVDAIITEQEELFVIEGIADDGEWKEVVSLLD